ncbi:hypothetical protein POX_b02721 [Penicillium oxalicum]|uniref:hypothetical protein n=1 Tax=Penicillium oxalicum TaxID=69781 RepID=UPI0020B839C7|nr:hypothetical protein POX_b02721 [Penicillium oxalicum]KAI2792680.1 hypothetical protein POX_b02721 [Penicillium oxalicum]
MNHPSPRKHLVDRDIYLSRNDWGLSPDKLGRSVMTDFGLAVRGDGLPNSHPIQPEGYRAPEIWDLFYGRGPFDTPPNARESGSANEAHLGQIISLLGPPPPDLLSWGKETSRYFDAKGMLARTYFGVTQFTDLIGRFKFPELIGEKDLVSMAKEIDNDDEIPQFVDFISRMLRWRPDDRTTAEDLLSHPWLPQMKSVNG